MKNNHGDAKHPTGSVNHPRQSSHQQMEQKDERSETNMRTEGKRAPKSNGAQTKSGMRHSKSSHK